MLFNLEKGPYYSTTKKINFLYKTFPSFFFLLQFDVYRLPGLPKSQERTLF